MKINNTTLPMLCRILSSLIDFFMLGVTCLAAYQAGYIVLSTCLIACIPIRFLSIVKSFSAKSTSSELHTTLIFITYALVYITSSILQSSLLLLSISSIILLISATKRHQDDTITDPFTLLFGFISLVAFNNLAFSHIFSSVFSLVGIEKWVIISLKSITEIIAYTQKITWSLTGEASPDKQSVSPPPADEFGSTIKKATLQPGKKPTEEPFSCTIM
jgi:hypothetical protein